MFDELTSSKLKHYVYALINPNNDKVFYIGKGHGNRVFDHINNFENYPVNSYTRKLNEIAEIIQNGREIKHYILRHGLSKEEAYLVESVLIDYNNTFLHELTNEVSGHFSSYFGLKTTDELIRMYNAPELEELTDPVIIININKKYRDTRNNELTIYEATKQAWVINERRLKSIKYALSEFQGIIIGVFKIISWYKVESDTDLKKIRWGFDGCEAAFDVKNKYLNRSIAKYKKKGAANPIRFKI
jgi:hypothetical protein